MENSSFEVSSMDDPQLILGRSVEVFWPEEEDWYSGVVAEKVRCACQFRRVRHGRVGQATTPPHPTPWHGALANQTPPPPT